MKINPPITLNLLSKCPTFMVGLFCVTLLNGCQTTPTPEQVTTKFWQALAEGQVETAKKYATANSQHLVNVKEINKLSTIITGTAIVEEPDALVETTITRHDKRVTFNTVLLMEQNNWRVDYLQTHTNIAMLPFDGVIKSLQNLGDTFAKQLEQAVPIIEKELESLGNQLQGEIEELGRNLEKHKKLPGGTTKPHPGTI